MSDQNPSLPPEPQIPQIPKPQTASGAVPVVQIQSLSASSASTHVPVHVPAPTAAAPTPPPVFEQAVHDATYPAPVMHYPVQAHIPPAKPRNKLMKYLSAMGAGSLFISLLVHAALITLAVLIVTITVKEPKVDFLPGGGSKGAAEASQALSQKVQNKKRTAIAKSTPMRKVVSNSTNATISLPDIPMEAVDVPEMSSMMGGAMGSGGFGQAGAGGGFGKGNGIGGQAGFVSLPPSMKSRCSSAERLQKLKEGGVTTDCEKAVSTALEYLKSKQKPDGSWGTSNKCGMTGMALLCYLGRCETPDSPFFGDNVMKGILFLIETQRKNPNGMFVVEGSKGNGGVYEHGIATYAMGEMYSLARLGGKQLPGMREAFENGVKVIIDNQQKGGSWVYDGTGNYSQGREDLSVTGWQYQALKSAKLSGLKMNGLYPAIDKTVKYLEGKQTKDGGFGSANREGGYNQWNLSGVGILGLQTLAHGKSTAIKKGLKFASDFHQKEPPQWKGAELYDWYYYAQVYFQNGGAEQKYWNETALPEILKNQAKDGSWAAPAGARHSAAGGDKILSTAFCTLMLEVYYRYLKVGDKEEGSIFSR
jgi:Prenyltransferase and squalene oxidase repeat